MQGSCSKELCYLVSGWLKVEEPQDEPSSSGDLVRRDCKKEAERLKVDSDPRVSCSKVLRGEWPRGQARFVQEKEDNFVGCLVLEGQGELTGRVEVEEIRRELQTWLEVAAECDEVSFVGAAHEGHERHVLFAKQVVVRFVGQQTWELAWTERLTVYGLSGEVGLEVDCLQRADSHLGRERMLRTNRVCFRHESTTCDHQVRFVLSHRQDLEVALLVREHLRRVPVRAHFAAQASNQEVCPQKIHL